MCEAYLMPEDVSRPRRDGIDDCNSVYERADLALALAAWCGSQGSEGHEADQAEGHQGSRKPRIRSMGQRRLQQIQPFLLPFHVR